MLVTLSSSVRWQPSTPGCCVTHQNQVAPFAAACPYVMGYVQTDEGPRLLTHIVGCEPADVRIGMKVVADFQPQERADGEAFAVVRFRPAD